MKARREETKGDENISEWPNALVDSCEKRRLGAFYGVGRVNMLFVERALR